MAELAEIAAAAGISIVDDEDGEDAQICSASNGQVEVMNKPDHTGDYVVSDYSAQISELEALFSNRYSEDSDPGYIENLKSAEAVAKPPTIADFYCRRQRDDARNWNRDRGGRGRGGHRGGGGYGNHRGWDNDRGWDRRDRDRSREGHPRNHGDNHYDRHGHNSHWNRQPRRDQW